MLALARCSGRMLSAYKVKFAETPEVNVCFYNTPEAEEDTHMVLRNSTWPNPLQNAYNLGLLPLVRRFRSCRLSYPFIAQKFNRQTLRYFSALTNLQELGIDELAGVCGMEGGHMTCHGAT